jgi:hypothetical protein
VADNILLGTILWAKFGPRGQYKKRPAVVLGEPDSSGILYVVVGSKKLPRDPSHGIELPWDHQGRCRTKLKVRTIVDISWRRRIHIDDVLQVGGILPPKILVEIQDAIRRLFPNSAKPS